MQPATIQRLVQLFKEHGTSIMLFQANDLLKKEGLVAPKSRFYHVKKRYCKGDYQKPR